MSIPTQAPSSRRRHARQTLLPLALGAVALGAVIASAPAWAKQVNLLNVSYDPTRELYQDINAAFAPVWKAKTGDDVTIQTSNGGSGKQARAVIDGLQADVVTLALAYDIDAIASKGLTATDWQKRLPANATPYTSTIVFLVRKGNPKHIHSWDDLTRAGTSVITANPKTSGGARWAYLAAYGNALKANHGDDAKARAYIKALYEHVPVLDSGARGATITFSQRGLGDVLLAWESEISLIKQEFGNDKFEVVYPPASILAQPPVAVVDKVADAHGTQEVAKAFLEFLYTPQAQEIEAKRFFRPTDPKVAAKYASQFPKLNLFNIDDTFGGWSQAQKTHFADGGVFDQIYARH